MTTPIAVPLNGFFAQLMPMLAGTLMLTPLCCTGTPEELDRDLPAQLRDFVAGHLALSNNLAQIQREREEAEKAAREELKKKQKTVGSGGPRRRRLSPSQREGEPRGAGTVHNESVRFPD